MFSEFGHSFLLDQFREFHEAVVEAVPQARSLVRNPETGEACSVSDNSTCDSSGPVPGHVSGSVVDGVSGDAVASPQHNESSAAGGVDDIRERLFIILERQGLEARQKGGDYGARYYEEAQYVMAALADDVFIAMDWAGAAAWSVSPLEYRLFGSKLAGVEFYRRLDRLLEHRDSARTELAAVFLLGISLGFQGKFRGRDDRGALQRYRERLYNFIYNRSPRPGGGDLLFPEAYSMTVAEGDVRNLPAVRRWFKALAVIVVLLLGVSHFLWGRATSGLLELLDKILTAGL